VDEVVNVEDGEGEVSGVVSVDIVVVRLFFPGFHHQ
jgi:hypothetical protein